MNKLDKLLLTEDEAAELLSMSSHFLRRDRISENSIGIPFIHVGAAVRYRPRDLEDWILEQKKAPPSPKPAKSVQEIQQRDKRRRGRPTKATQVAEKREEMRIRAAGL